MKICFFQLKNLLSKITSRMMYIMCRSEMQWSRGMNGHMGEILTVSTSDSTASKSPCPPLPGYSTHPTLFLSPMTKNYQSKWHHKKGWKILIFHWINPVYFLPNDLANHFKCLTRHTSHISAHELVQTSQLVFHPWFDLKTIKTCFILLASACPLVSKFLLRLNYQFKK